MQDVLMSGQALGIDGGNLEAAELTTGLIGSAGGKADGGPGEQRPQAAGAPSGDPRAHDPELRVLAKELGCIRSEGCAYQVASILGEADACDAADADVLIPDQGFARLDAIRGPEGDGDGGSFGQPALEGDPAAEQGGDQGNQPDQGGPVATGLSRLGFG